MTPPWPLGRVPAGVRAVFFDAVGTLIHPEPSAGSAYALAGRRFGSRLAADEVRRRFARAFKEQEEADALGGHRTDEGRERRRWLNIVRAVLDDVCDGEGCFRALYDHFAEPSSWRVEPGAPEVIAALRRAGYAVGTASNFDHRLRGVLGGLAELAGLEHVVISSEVGWKKPSREFFAALCGRAGLAPREVLLVGDDLDNDYLGALAAGLEALLFDPLGSSSVPPQRRLVSLGDLL